MHSADKKFRREEYPQPPQPSSTYPSDRGTGNNSARSHAKFVNQAASSNDNIHAIRPTHAQTPATHPHQAVPAPFQPQQFLPFQQYVPYQVYVVQHWSNYPQTFAASYQQTEMRIHPSYAASAYPGPTVYTSPQQQQLHQHGYMRPIHESAPHRNAETRKDPIPAPSPGSNVHLSHQSSKVIKSNNSTPLSGKEKHHHEDKKQGTCLVSTPQNDPDLKRGHHKPISDAPLQNSETSSPQHTELSKQPVKKDHEELDRLTSEPQRHHSGDSSGRLMELDDSNSKESKQSVVKSSAKSETAGLTFIGNPGSGKSTLLNGIAGKAVFPAGISLGTGLTTSISEYVHNGVSLFDTPGLADIEQKKHAGQELDIMLSKPILLKIAFVVTLERGRVRPDDAVTIDLVLDAIKEKTDNKFGVIINRVSKLVRNEIGIPEIEKRIQRSLTGKHSTSHWCYIDSRDDLEDKNDAKLITPDLERFLQRLPETKQKHTRTVPIDTDSVEDKMEIQKDLIRDIELGWAEELRKIKEASRLKKETYDEQEAALLRKEQDLSAKLQEERVDSTSGRASQNRNEAEGRPPPGEKHQGGLKSKIFRRKRGG